MANWFSLFIHMPIQAPDRSAAIAKLENALARAGLSATVLDIFAITERQAGWDGAGHQHPAFWGSKEEEGKNDSA